MASTCERLAAELTLPERVFILTYGTLDPGGRGYSGLTRRGLADSWGYTTQGQRVARIIIDGDRS
jgi:hypothetical protein